MPTHFVNADDIRVPELRRRAGFPEKLLDSCAVELLTSGNLDRYQSIELCVMRFPDRSELPHSKPFQEFEMRDRRDCRPVAGGLVGHQIKLAAAGWAVHVREVGVVDDFKGLVTMRAANMHL